MAAAKTPILLPQVSMAAAPTPAQAAPAAGPSNEDILRAAMDAQGITNNQTRAGIAAVVTGETSFVFRPELGYANTSNDRIRTIFGSRVMGMTDDMIDKLKADPVAFFNKVYGGAWGARNLGNTQPNDGYDFRGRGPIQLTGRGNYVRYGKLCGHPEIVTSPNVLDTDPAIGCAMTVAYIKDRYRGGGWEGLKAAVGNSFGNVDDIKNEAYQRFLQSGEYNYGGAQAPAGQTAPVTVPAPVTAPPVVPPSPQVKQPKAVDDSEDEAEALNAQELNTH